MSSTNRGGQRSPADFYGTPRWCVIRLLERLKLPYGFWYEPCAGQGAIIQAVNSYRADVEWYANELNDVMRPDLEKLVPKSHLTIGDYCADDLVLPRARDVSVVITNPPFRLAWPILHKTLLAYPNSDIVLLLRIGFIASGKRHQFMVDYTPDTYVLPNRPGFKRWGKSDSPDYAWFHWGPAPRLRDSGSLTVLGLTWQEERKRDAQAALEARMRILKGEEHDRGEV